MTYKQVYAVTRLYFKLLNLRLGLFDVGWRLLQALLIISNKYCWSVGMCIILDWTQWVGY